MYNIKYTNNIKYIEQKIEEIERHVLIKLIYDTVLFKYE